MHGPVAMITIPALVLLVGILGCARLQSYGSAAPQYSGDHYASRDVDASGDERGTPGEAEYSFRTSGEATSVFRIYPTHDGTELDLRNGTVLLVPGSLNVPANLREGVWIEATARREGNQNIVRSLDVLQEGPVSHG